MSHDLGSIVRAVGGECLPIGITDRSLVDVVTEIDAFVVVGNPDFVTLVTGPVETLQRRLAAAGDTEDPLIRAVFVSDEDSPALRALLARHGMSAILGAEPDGAALHAILRTLIAEDRAASDRLVAAGMNLLTQVARRGGVTAVIAELAHRIDGWAVLLDAQGQLIASAGAGRLHISDATAVALGRPVRVRHVGLQVHQVGSDRDLAGSLVVATRSGSTSRSRDLATQAAALFDLLLRTHDPSRTEHLGREALFDVLLAGGDPARDLLRRWGVHETHLTGFAFGARTRTIDLERVLRRWFDELGAEHVFTADPGRVRGFLRTDLVDELAARVESFTPVGGSHVALGIGDPAPTERLGPSATQARQALDTALEDGQRILHYARLPSIELVMSGLAGIPREQLSGVLDPLRDADGAHGELTRTLRVFLSEHGGHRSSAARLGIHRQTLRSRIGRVEELTGLSMEHADDRATAWIALRAIGR
ncbi:helix-turn-helix domain-containing protein [Leucobacter rhizosphaerae]|uniref:Helix-turn-helix domain-containing protein n=1 Tax=Leucobacter rhizosphaerae TaxID=2932245 RepID=A0ABY4FVF8_9MICO|nr:PucR family transcriptional regulator [Leucobacter rhizosphaerae]UOQ60257.1 helix-turn-helix domain-containing protein [Leucobacter rhizosphaerae]